MLAGAVHGVELIAGYGHLNGDLAIGCWAQMLHSLALPRAHVSEVRLEPYLLDIGEKPRYES